MYPSQFEHVPAKSLEHAVTLLQEHDDAELLAGGQSLVPLQKTRFATPDHLIDITGLGELEYVEDAGNEIRIGALARHTQIQEAPPVRSDLFLFSECIGQIADWPVRNQGTFGGTVAEADPSGDYLPVLQVTNPEFTVVGPDGERDVAFEDLYLGMFTVDIDDAELLTEGRFSKLRPGDGAAAVGTTYRKHAQRSGDYALVGVAAVVEVDADGVVTDARLSVGAVGPLTRPEEAENAVEGTALADDALEEAAAATRDAVIPDEEGTEGEYKREMAGEFVERALRTAHERATNDL